MKPTDSTLHVLSILLILFSIAAAVPQTSTENNGFGILRDSAWSADGAHFLTVTGSGAQIYAWDGESLTLQSTLDTSRRLRCGVLAADGSQVYLGTEEGVIEQWDALSAVMMTDWEAHRLPILDLAIDSDDTHLLSIGWRSDALVWNLGDNPKQTTLETSRVGAATGSFAPDGSAALWSKEFSIQLFDANNGAITASRATQFFSQTPVFSSDGSLLAGVYAGQAQVIDVITGKLVQAFDADFTIQSITISPDNSKAVVLSDASQYLLYDLISGFLLERWEAQPGSLHHNVTFSPQSDHLFLLGSAIHSRDLRTLGIVSQFHITGRADAYAVSPDGQTLASRVDKLNYVEIWQNGIAKPTQTLTDFPVPVMDAQFLPDGRLLVSADSLTVWDTLKGEQAEEWQAPLPSGAAEFVVWVYDPDSQQSQQVKLDHLPLGKIGVSADARRIAAEGMDGSLYVWEVDSAQTQPIAFPLGILNTAKSMNSQVTTILFSPDGTQVLVWLSNDTLRVFDLPTKTETTVFTLPPGTPDFDKTCLRQWDAPRQTLQLADSSNQYEINPADGSITQTVSGICGFNGANYTIENNQIDLPNATLSISANRKDSTPQLYLPEANLLIYQNGRFSDYSIFLRHADADSQQQDLFTTLTADQYLGAPVKASQYDFTEHRVSLIDTRGNFYHNGSLQTAFGFSPAAAAFSNDGRQLLLSGFDGSVILQIESEIIPLLDAKTRPQVFRALAFNPSGTDKAAGNDAGMVMVWDENDNPIRFETPGGAVQELRFSPDGSYLAVRGSDFISLWQLTSAGGDPRMLEPTPRGTAMAFSPDGKVFLTSTRDGFETPLLVWSFPALQRQSRYKLSDAQQIVFSTNTRFFLRSNQLWDCTLNENCRTMEIPETFTTGNLFIAADNTTVVLITIDGRVVEVTLSD